jgi:HORMA domain
VLMEIHETIFPSIQAAVFPDSSDELQGTQKADSGAHGDRCRHSKGDQHLKRRLLEVFSFSVSYPNSKSDPVFSISRSRNADMKNEVALSKDSIKKNTSEVLRLLVEMTSTLQPLPENRSVSVKLLYTPKTPATYEPPLFQAASDESMGCWFENRPLRQSPGKICTPYHEMSICIRTASDVRSKPQDDEMDGGTSSASTNSSIGDSESTRAPNLTDLNQQKVNDIAAATEQIDIGASYGNSCRGATRTHIASSGLIKKEVHRARDERASECKIFPAADCVTKMTLDEEKPGRSPEDTSKRTVTAFEIAKTNNDGSASPKHQMNHLRLRIRVDPNCRSVSHDVALETKENKQNVHSFENEGRKQSIEQKPDTDATNGTTLPPCQGRNGGDSEQASLGVSNVRKCLKRRKVSEVQSPVEQKPKRLRRSIRTRGRLGSKDPGGTENVSTCF